MELNKKFHVGRLIYILGNQLKRRNHVPKEMEELTNIHRLILRYILFQDLLEEANQRDIEREFQIRKSTVSGILQLMEKKGLILRKYSDKDKRVKKLIPTEKSIAMRSEILEEIRKTEQCLVRGIEDWKIDICKEVLIQMINNLGGTQHED